MLLGFAPPPQEAIGKGLGEPCSLFIGGMTLALTFLEGLFLSLKWGIIIVLTTMGWKGTDESIYVKQKKFLAQNYHYVYDNNDTYYYK